MDAAVATALALAVTWPSAGNLGGGGFMVYHGADAEVTTFDFREKAPLHATERMYLNADGTVRDNTNHDGFLAIGVPGTVAGLFKAHQRLGRLPWSELVAPAVEAPRIHHQWLPDRTHFERWGISADTRRLYRSMGHEVRIAGAQGRVMAVSIDDARGLLYGAADSRSPDGAALGY